MNINWEKISTTYENKQFDIFFHFWRKYMLIYWGTVWWWFVVFLMHMWYFHPKEMHMNAEIDR